MDRIRRILVVDDESSNRDLLTKMLKALGYYVDSAIDGLKALDQLKLGYDLILLDVMMPGMDGFEVVRKIRAGTEYQDIPICMVTGLSSREDRLRAVEAGVNDFIAKPFDMMELKIRTNSLLREKESREALKRYHSELEATVAKRTEALRQALKETADAQRRTYQAQLETIERLAMAAEHRDRETAYHIKRMSRYCHLIAKKLGLPPQECELILNATPMHDVGKIGIPDGILLKPGKLDPSEWEIMKKHSEIGALILSGSSSDLLQAGEIIARSHHERWDGTGYPMGLSGENIPLWGRITALADVFDALTNKRPYKDAFSNEMAVQIMKEARGIFFDPKLLDIFLDNISEVFAIQAQYMDTLADNRSEQARKQAECVNTEAMRMKK